MFGIRLRARRSSHDEAEKPFWISFADLMTALMVLFLIVMSVALLAVTKSVTERERLQAEHQHKIELILRRFEEAAAKYPGIRVDRERQVIDFGARAQFAYGDWRLDSNQEEVLRQFVPEILIRANDELGKSILKRIVVEGYTDQKGTYLANLNLSLIRSQKVLCAMFTKSGSNLLDDEQKNQIRELFSVGGYSFNSAKDTPAASRRVEMRLEFLDIGETRPHPPISTANFGQCALPE